MIFVLAVLAVTILLLAVHVWVVGEIVKGDEQSLD